MPRVYTVYSNPNRNGPPQYFASLDGQNWVPTNRPATDDDAENLRTLIEGQEDNGIRRGLVVYTSRYLRHMGYQIPH